MREYCLTGTKRTLYCRYIKAKDRNAAARVFEEETGFSFYKLDDNEMKVMRKSK